MNQAEFPQELIFPESSIVIAFDDHLTAQETRETVIISGNKNGFMSLAHLINVFNTTGYNRINITDFSFVKSVFSFEIQKNKNLTNSLYGRVEQIDPVGFVWYLSENSLFVITGFLHSMGYANHELHFDPFEKDALSVYCVIE